MLIRRFGSDFKHGYEQFSKKELSKKEINTINSYIIRKLYIDVAKRINYNQDASKEINAEKGEMIVSSEIEKAEEPIIETPSHLTDNDTFHCDSISKPIITEKENIKKELADVFSLQMFIDAGKNTDPTDYIITGLYFGYVKGISYEIDTIAKLFDMDKSEVLLRIKRVLEYYKEYLGDLINLTFEGEGRK